MSKGSTLFTDALGYSDEDLALVPTSNTDASKQPSNEDMAKQNPFAKADGTIADAKDRTFFHFNQPRRSSSVGCAPRPEPAGAVREAAVRG